MMIEYISAVDQRRRNIFSAILLALVIVYLFILPGFPVALHKPLYNILITAILVFAALSMDRERKRIFIIAIVTIVAEWIAYFFDMSALMTLSQTVLLLYFVLIVIGLIIQVATTSKVTARVIVESITGYLLMGIVISMIIMVIARNLPGAYLIGDQVYTGAVNGSQYNLILYYGFTTYTTLGYGDIVPVVPLSRALSTFASVTGQIYLTVIIAMLVGKFLSRRRES
jgi:hypothetical protein